MKDQRTEIAQVIAEQLGGVGALRLMIGARNVGAITTDDGLNGLRVQFKARAPYNEFVVALEPTDTYRVTFTRLRMGRATATKAFTDIYAEALRSLIEAQTGLILTVPKIYRVQSR